MVTEGCSHGGSWAVVSFEGSMGGGPTSKFMHVVVGRTPLFIGCWTEASGPRWLLARDVSFSIEQLTTGHWLPLE